MEIRKIFLTMSEEELKSLPKSEAKQIANSLGFKGDLNVLLSGAENTKEANYFVNKIRSIEQYICS